LKTRARDLKLEDRITFHGKVAQRQVIELLGRADVFCFPTSASEGFPKVVLEALSCGLPVLTTRVSVLPKLIGPGAGVLIDDPGIEAIAGGIEKICSNPDEYKKMSERASATAQKYTLENWRDAIGERLRRAWRVSSLSSGFKPDSPGAPDAPAGSVSYENTAEGRF
jgi:glycosyltransferase involved in cell wall biosynthesis